MIYLDNAATTFPKPDRVIDAVSDCIMKWCANAGRSSHELALRTDEEIYTTRELLSEFLNFNKPENIVFTLNATYALNTAIKTLIPEGSHVLISDIEHNSVLRPIESLKRYCSCSYSIFNSSNKFEDNIEKKIKKNTKAIVSTLMSNVTGAEIPLERLYEIAKKHRLKLIVDASQLVGHKKIDLSKYTPDALCAPAHKGLFGIQGAGFVCFCKDIPKRSFIEGGSGNNSLLRVMPEYLPEHFEAGTLPTPSIAALGAGIKFINDIGLEQIQEKIDYLTFYFSNKLQRINGIEIFGRSNGIISFRHNKDIGNLISKAGICIRSGLHCSPLAHKKLGTINTGLFRVSLSYFNTENDLDTLISLIEGCP